MINSQTTIISFKRIDFWPKIPLIWNTPGPSKQAGLFIGTIYLWCQNVSAAMCLAEILGAEISCNHLQSDVGLLEILLCGACTPAL